jgi:hypothetical protein
MFVNLTLLFESKPAGGWIILDRERKPFPEVLTMTTLYSFALLDARPIPAAIEKNNGIFGCGPVFGIEVTVPELAARCVANIDPQHSGGFQAGLAAIEVALNRDLPADGSILATVKPDVDSVGAMAVLYMRRMGVPITPEMLERIQLIAKADKFDRGDWPGRRPLPTRENPWPEHSGKLPTQRLAAITSCVGDFLPSIEERVCSMIDWIMEEDKTFNPDGSTARRLTHYREVVERERQELITALENDEISYRLVCGGKVAIVVSEHRAATMIGYSLAPVVIAMNPNFRQGLGEPYLKYTICSYSDRPINLANVYSALNELEPGWGGGPTIIGSPQGVSSQLSMHTLVDVVSDCLRY